MGNRKDKEEGAQEPVMLPSCQQKKWGLVGRCAHDARVCQMVSSFAEGSLRVKNDCLVLGSSLGVLGLSLFGVDSQLI